MANTISVSVSNAKFPRNGAATFVLRNSSKYPKRNRSPARKRKYVREYKVNSKRTIVYSLSNAPNCLVAMDRARPVLVLVLVEELIAFVVKLWPHLNKDRLRFRLNRLNLRSRLRANLVRHRFHAVLRHLRKSL